MSDPLPETVGPRDAKPCPFCGQEPYMRRVLQGHRSYVHCDCGASGAWRDNRRDAVAAWNRVADAADLAVLLARVEEKYPADRFSLDPRRGRDGQWFVRVFEISALRRVASGNGHTLVAALRALLGEEVA